MAKSKNAATSGDNGAEKAPRAPKGPELSWNGERRMALAVAVASGVSSTAQLAAELSQHPAFSDVPQGAITASKIRLQLANLRKAGVNVPKFGRSREGIDVASLNALFGGEQATA